MFVLLLEWGAETSEEIVQVGKVCLVWAKGGLATSCMSCCSYVVKATSVVLILFSEMFCLFVSL